MVVCNISTRQIAKKNCNRLNSISKRNTKLYFILKRESAVMFKNKTAIQKANFNFYLLNNLETYRTKIIEPKGDMARKRADCCLSKTKLHGLS